MYQYPQRNSMADVHTPEQRSYTMSRVKSKDTKRELMSANSFMPRASAIDYMTKPCPVNPT
jgi:G:T-mismatch repair DNA endonuclease (very short patch repair protein)